MRDPLYTGALTRRGLAADVLTAGVFGAVVTPVHYTQSSQAGIATILITVALAFRRSAPTLMIIFTLSSAALQVATSDIAVIACLAYFPLMVTLGGHPMRSVRVASLVMASSGSVLAAWVLPSAYGAPQPDRRLITLLFAFAASAVVVIGGWALGFIQYQRRSVQEARVAETIAELERRRVLDVYAEQTERTRLARDMHDVVAHSLTIVVAQAEGARFAFDDDPASSREALRVIADTARDALGDVRLLLEQLRSEDRSDASRSDRAALFARMRAAGMTIDDAESGDPDLADDAVQRVAHRVLTEALTNALKYGELTEPVVVHTVWGDGGCHIVVRSTISHSPLAPGGAGHGIPGMAERAALVGGRLSSAAAEDGTWLVSLSIPAQSIPDQRNPAQSIPSQATTPQKENHHR